MGIVIVFILPSLMLALALALEKPDKAKKLKGCIDECKQKHS